MPKEMSDKELQRLYHYLYRLIEVEEMGGVGDLTLYLQAKEEMEHRGLPVLRDPLDTLLGVVACE
jgi:hypothetical protein